MKAKKRKARIIKKRPAARAAPFAGLGPQVVLDAAMAFGFESDGRLFALNSYENRVYQVGSWREPPPDKTRRARMPQAQPPSVQHGGDFVVKFYRPGRWTDRQILEEHAFAAELASAELNVAAPMAVKGRTLLRHRGFRFAVFPWKPGRTPELDAPQAREMLGRALGRLHRIGSAGEFDARPQISVERLGHSARRAVLRSPLLPESLRKSYSHASAALLQRVEQAFGSVGELRALRIHGDCHLGNLLWDEHGPVFVDLDDCATGPAVQDLWMLLSGSPSEQQLQWQDLLTGYQQFADFDFRELLIMEPLRALRMIHHAAWIAQRWKDPAFPRAFPGFAETRYWESHIADLLEQCAAIDTPPLLCS